MGRIRAAVRRVATGVAWAFVGVALLVGYGIRSDDVRVLSEFSAGVERWQTGPEFRNVAYEYVQLSHAAMNSTPWGVRATSIIMAIRSVPGLPPEYAVSDTSQAHYDAFTRGELSAYLHLCGEQTMDWVLRDLHRIASAGSADADVEAFLRAWKMNRPVASDAAAVAGVKRLLAEVDATKPFEPRAQIQAELASAAAALAARLGYPADPVRMTRDQQRDVFARLDADVRTHRPELWRLKQVSDLCAGIWAQTFGGDYAMVITPTLAAGDVCRLAGPAMAVGLFGGAVVRKRRRRVAAEGAGGGMTDEA
jgi:hypothetical protein